VDGEKMAVLIDTEGSSILGNQQGSHFLQPNTPAPQSGSPTSPENVRRALQNAGFSDSSIKRLAGTKTHPGVNPELALVAARAKQIYEAAHPNRSFEVEQGFRTQGDQARIAARGSAFTNCSGKKGHESPHQFGQAIDIHIYERQRNGKFLRQEDKNEKTQDYIDAAKAMKQAAQELGYADKMNYGALGDVHVGHGRSRHNDWGHLEEKRRFWNQWHPASEQPEHKAAHPKAAHHEHHGHQSHHRHHKHHHRHHHATTVNPASKTK
jgi:hypothetical protein